MVLTLLLGVYFAFKPGGDRIASKKSYYTVVVDCGSTGTRVNVFEWVSFGSSKRDLPILLHSYHDNSTKTLLWESSCKNFLMQTEPGLDKFVGNSPGLEPLIMWAEKMVPFERHRSSPIFVLATVGLRRLAIE